MTLLTNECWSVSSSCGTCRRVCAWWHWRAMIIGCEGSCSTAAASTCWVLLMIKLCAFGIFATAAASKPWKPISTSALHWVCQRARCLTYEPPFNVSRLLFIQISTVLRLTSWRAAWISRWKSGNVVEPPGGSGPHQQHHHRRHQHRHITIMILIIIIGLLYSPLESTIFIYRCFFLFSKLNLTHHNHRRRRREGFNSGSTN